MSVIMRTPSGKIRLYCKGAVSVCASPWQLHDSSSPLRPKIKAVEALHLLLRKSSEQQHKARTSYFTHRNKVSVSQEGTLGCGWKCG